LYQSTLGSRVIKKGVDCLRGGRLSIHHHDGVTLFDLHIRESTVLVDRHTDGTLLNLHIRESTVCKYKGVDCLGGGRLPVIRHDHVTLLDLHPPSM